MKYVWRLWYWLIPTKDRTSHDIIIEFCRKNDVLWQEIASNRSRWNKESL